MKKIIVLASPTVILVGKQISLLHLFTSHGRYPSKYGLVRDPKTQRKHTLSTTKYTNKKVYFAFHPSVDLSVQFVPPVHKTKSCFLCSFGGHEGMNASWAASATIDELLQEWTGGWSAPPAEGLPPLFAGSVSATTSLTHTHTHLALVGTSTGIANGLAFTPNF